MLELAILGLLKEQDLHGYELKKRLSDLFGFVSVSFGSLYPALGRLERGGAVRAAVGEPSAAEVPATGSLTGELALLRAGWGGSGARRTGRSRKVYSITARGHELFAELLAADNQSSEDERTFHLRLAFAGYLPRDARLGLLERRRAHLLQRRSALRSRTSRRERLDAWASSLIEHDQETNEHDLSWIERLIASERSGGYEPTPPEAGPAPAAATAAAFSTNTPRAAAPTVSVLRPSLTEEDLTS
ncbi:MAG: PadR family transcriptional regulator [Acidimicrobiaceae bacterium]|nr:PadR family transcriptional regulator [Acidimicrobiaceae bacterium]